MKKRFLKKYLSVTSQTIKKPWRNKALKYLAFLEFIGSLHLQCYLLANRVPADLMLPESVGEIKIR